MYETGYKVVGKSKIYGMPIINKNYYYNFLDEVKCKYPDFYANNVGLLTTIWNTHVENGMQGVGDWSAFGKYGYGGKWIGEPSTIRAVTSIATDWNIEGQGSIDNFTAGHGSLKRAEERERNRRRAATARKAKKLRKEMIAKMNEESEAENEKKD